MYGAAHSGKMSLIDKPKNTRGKNLSLVLIGNF